MHVLLFGHVLLVGSLGCASIRACASIREFTVLLYSARNQSDIRRQGGLSLSNLATRQSHDSFLRSGHHQSSLLRVELALNQGPAAG